MIHTTENSSAYLQTGDEGSNNLLLWTAQTPGASGNNITITIINPGANSPAVSVGVVGNNITVTLKTNGSAVSTSTLDNVKIAIESSASASALIKVAKVYSGTNGNVQAMTLTSLQYGGGAVLHQIITLAGHEIDGVEKLYLDGNEVAFGASPDVRWATGRYAGRVFMAVNLGGDNQDAQPDCVNQLPGVWTTDHRQRGCAHVYLILRFENSIFPEGLPDIEFLVRGKKCYDPRGPTTAWTRNAALIARDYLTNTRYGAGLTSIDDTNVSAAANVCDQLISKLDSSTEPRYLIDGVFDPTEGPDSIIEQIKMAFAGEIFERDGGKVWLAPGVWTEPTITFTEDDLRGSVKITTHVSRSERFNCARGTHMGADYQETDIAPQKNSTYITQDGGIEVYQDFALNFVYSPTQAQRILKIELEKIRQGIVVDIELKLSGLLVAVGDFVYLTIAKYGWSSKPFLVAESEIVEEGDYATGCNLSLRESASGVYYWDIGSETTIDVAPNTTLPDPFSILPPSNIVVTSGTAELYLRGDGTVQSRMKVSWDISADAFVSGGGKYEIRYKKTTDSNWIAVEQEPYSSSFHYVLGVQDGATYNVEVRAVNVLGVGSSWVAATNHTVVGKTQAPSNVTGFSVTKQILGLVFSWNEINDLDRAEYEIRVGASWAAGTLVWRGRGANYRWEFKTAGSYSFYIKAIDTSGNYSTTEASQNITINLPSTPTLSMLVSGPNAIATWAVSTGDFAIKEYEIRYGVDFASGTPVGIATTNTHTLRVNWGGSRTFWIVARDIAGNESSASGFTLVINNPNSAQNFSVTTVDNNVLLDWTDPIASSLPIAEYKIYKGSVFGTAILLGTVYGTFHTYIEEVGGEFTYWVVSIDTAGNVSAEEDYTVTVSPPRNYVLRSSLDFITDAATDSSISERLKYARRISGNVVALSHLTPTVYLDGGRNVTTVSGKVSAWGDLQNSNNATQGTDANRPYLTNINSEENICLYSKDLSNAAWARTGIQDVVTATGIFHPVTGEEVCLVKENASNGEHGLQITTTNVVIGKTYIFSKRFKAKEKTYAGFAVYSNGFGSTTFIRANLSTGVIESVTGNGIFNIYSEGDGWYLITCQRTASATAAAQFGGRLNISNNYTYTGTLNDGLYMTAGQIREMGTSSNYLSTITIPKYAGLNTNSGLLFDGGTDGLGTSLPVNPTGGMSGFAVFKPNIANANQVIYSVYPTSARVSFGFDSVGKCEVTVFKDSSNYIGRTTNSGQLVANEAAIWSWTYDGTTSPTGIKIFKNGVQVDTTSITVGTYTVPTAGGNLSIGVHGNGTGWLNGYLYEMLFTQGSTLSTADHKLEIARLRDKYLEPSSDGMPDKIMLPLDLETWDEWWTEEGWTTWNDAITAYNADFPTPNIKTGYAKWQVDYGTTLPASFVRLVYNRELVGDDITLTPTIKLSLDAVSWTTYAGADEVYSGTFRYAQYILDFTGVLGTELINLTEVNATVSLKTDEEEHIITCDQYDTYLGAPGTYLEFEKNYIAVSKINATVLSNAASPITIIVDFDNVPNPTHCLILAYDTNTGLRTTTDVSVSIKGAVTT